MKKYIQRYPGASRVESLAGFLMMNGFDVSVHHRSSKIKNSTRKFKKEFHQKYPIVKWVEVMVKGKGILASFATKNGYTYTNLNFHIAADPEVCFNKWSQCSVVLSLENRSNEEILHYLSLLTIPSNISKIEKWGVIVDDLYHQDE